MKGLFIIQIWAAVEFCASYLLLSDIRASGRPETIFCDDCNQLKYLESEKSKVLRFYSGFLLCPLCGCTFFPLFASHVKSLSFIILSLVISQVEEELLEQEFLERCFQEMLEEEDQDWFIPSRDLNNQGVGQLQQQLNGLSVNDHHSNLEEVAVSQRCISFHKTFCGRWRPSSLTILNDIVH